MEAGANWTQSLTLPSATPLFATQPSGLSRRSIGICIAWCSALTALPLPISFTNKVPALAMLFLAVGMIEFDGIFILIGYAMVVATTLLYAVLGAIIWEMLISWGKLLH